MDWIEKFLLRFNGWHFQQEFLCLPGPNPAPRLYAYLTHNQKVIRDITGSHVFVGYCPLVFALARFSNDPYPLTTSITISFSTQLYYPNDIVTQKDAIAVLEMEKINCRLIAGTEIHFYEGKKAWHRFLHPFHQFAGRLHNSLYKKKKGNVFLKGNLFTQVQVAYALPRQLALITVGDAMGYNLFPTDLHGPIGDTHYVSSLRTGGRALEQVQRNGRIVIASVSPTLFRSVYALGKNHMKELQPRDRFPFNGQMSEILGAPLPQHTLSYKELEIAEVFGHGIHQMILYRVLHHQVSQYEAPLAHIHAAYATWKWKQSGTGNYLMR